jgi:hypothetical protein
MVGREFKMSLLALTVVSPVVEYDALWIYHWIQASLQPLSCHVDAIYSLSESKFIIWTGNCSEEGAHGRSLTIITSK